MPYRISQRGPRYCVLKQDDDRNMGCHDTREDALRQLRALHVNEADAVLQGLKAPLSQS